MSTIFNSADIAETMNNGVTNVTGADSIITENYTNVVQHGIKIDMSVSEKTICGTPPLPFNSNGTPLIDYTIYGNRIQGGTPTQLSECGNKTENLFDIVRSEVGVINSKGEVDISDSYSTSNYIAITEPFSLSLTSVFTSLRLVRIGYYDENKINIGVKDSSAFKNGYKVFTFTPPNGTRYIRFSYISRKGNKDTNIMLNLGSEALFYEPYGYKIPISVNERIYNVYIGNSPLRKAIDSSNAVDTINYGRQQLIRRVDSNGTALSNPITETIEVPLIATIGGINVIDVLTTLKPSNISITYKGR